MGLFDPNSDTFHLTPAFGAMIRRVGIDARGVFTDPRIQVWRKLADRENCTLDVEGEAGGRLRLHVKRYTPIATATPADEEQAGHRLLVEASIPTAPLVAWGVLTDRRSFTVWQDLQDYTPGDKLVESGYDFEKVLEVTAEMAAKLHSANLHHRDLYLCHFMIKPVEEKGMPLVSLIDTARVRKLPSFLTRRRWIVKDLAQFWYSTTKLPVSDEQRDRWLSVYAKQRGVSPGGLRRAIVRKAKAISRHDARLNAQQPTRNVSIPNRAQ